ncbi:MAG: hypothetical protein ACRECY_12715, partial [Phyllobacterium sp.]
GRAAEEVMAVGANLASFNFGEEVFFRAIEVADDMAAAWGGDLRSNLEGLSRALDDPVKGFAMLQKRGISLSDSQAALVKSLIASNDKLGAQKVVLQALEQQVKGVAEAGFQGMTRSLANLGSAIEGFFDKIVQGGGFGTILAAGIDRVTAAIDFLGEHMQQVATAAAIVGGGLLLAFSPALTAAIWAAATAMTTGILAGLTAIKAALLANPFTALVVGVTAAITAAYVFRDEIQKAIGVDVIGIVKDAANLVIGSFVAAFEDIKFVWNQFPNIIGSAVVGAVNVVVAGVRQMIQVAAGLVDGLIEKVNGALSLIPGANLSIGKIGDIGGGTPLANPYADALGKAVGDRNSAVSAAMNKDYIGEIGKAFTASTPAVAGMGAALAGVNDELDDMSGGGGKGKGGGGGKKGKVAKVKDQFDKVAAAIESAKRSLGQGFGDALQGLIDKSLSWKDALQQAGKALLKYLDQMNVAQGGKGLFGGGLVQGLIGGLIGFASGGTIMPGGAGGIDSQVVAFRKSPNERVDITKPGQTLSSGGRGGDTYHIDARGADAAAITRLERGLQERDRVFTKRVDSRVDTRHTRGTRA